jgi:hypothetical protein
MEPSLPSKLLCKKSSNIGIPAPLLKKNYSSFQTSDVLTIVKEKLW